jgi:hypothetical protein
MSSPSRAAGTKPKYDRTEYRPPMSGGLMNVRQNPRSRESCSSPVPGSVMATNWAPPRFPFVCCTRSQKWAKSDMTSMVPPDLLATRNKVLAGWIAMVTWRTHPGTVESSTHSRGEPFEEPNVQRRTSGPKLLPPIPRSTTSVVEASREAWAKERRSASPSCMWSRTVSHPRRFSISVGSGFQSEWSLVHRRSIAWLFAKSSSVWRILSLSNSCGLLEPVRIARSFPWDEGTNQCNLFGLYLRFTNSKTQTGRRASVHG